jgi:hypothetical protein
MYLKTKMMRKFPLAGKYRVLGPEDLSSEQSKAVDRLPRRAGINILRDRDLQLAVATEDGSPAAGLWTSWHVDRFTFDVVVDSTARGQGLAKHLVHHAIHKFNFDRAAYSDPMMVIYVVNPAMRELLEEHFGFSVALRPSPGRWEMIPTTNEAGAVVVPLPAGDEEALVA